MSTAQSPPLTHLPREVFERPARLAVQLARAQGAFVAVVEGSGLCVRGAVGTAARFVDQPTPSLADLGGGAVLSMPIVATDGNVFGALSVVDDGSREFTEEDHEGVDYLAGSIAAQIELDGLRYRVAELEVAPYDVAVVGQTEEALRRKAEFLEEQTATASLLKAVASAANKASTRTEALEFCLERVCTHMGWHVGHAFLVSYDRLVPTSLWFLASHDRFRVFREASEVAALAPERGLLGNVLRTGKAAWAVDVSTDLEYLRAGAARRAGLRGGFAFPVLAGGKVAAVLEFYTDQAQSPDPRVAELMASIGAQLGLVFERERERAQLEERAEQIRARSLVDDLTGLYNRRGFFETGRQRLRLASRDGRSLAVFFADLNGMKLINDHLGHENGDRALVDTADLLRVCFREADVVARLGGDEFAVVADGLSAAQLEAVKARFKAEIDALNSSRRRPYKLSVSVGVATYDPKLHKTFEDLIASADALMYAQKGKHLVSIGASASPPVSH